MNFFWLAGQIIQWVKISILKSFQGPISQNNVNKPIKLTCHWLRFKKSPTKLCETAHHSFWTHCFQKFWPSGCWTYNNDIFWLFVSFCPKLSIYFAIIQNNLFIARNFMDVSIKLEIVASYSTIFYISGTMAHHICKIWLRMYLYTVGAKIILEMRKSIWNSSPIEI